MKWISRCQVQEMGIVRNMAAPDGGASIACTWQVGARTLFLRHSPSLNPEAASSDRSVRPAAPWLPSLQHPSLRSPLKSSQEDCLAKVPSGALPFSFSQTWPTPFSPGSDSSLGTWMPWARQTSLVRVQGPWEVHGALRDSPATCGLQTKQKIPAPRKSWGAGPARCSPVWDPKVTLSWSH